MKHLSSLIDRLLHCAIDHGNPREHVERYFATEIEAFLTATESDAIDRSRTVVADLERVTKERDGWKAGHDRLMSSLSQAIDARADADDAVERLTKERDEARTEVERLGHLASEREAEANMARKQAGEWQKTVGSGLHAEAHFRAEHDAAIKERDEARADAETLCRVVGLAQRFVEGLGGARLRKGDLARFDPLLDALNKMPMRLMVSCLNAAKGGGE